MGADQAREAASAKSRVVVALPDPGAATARPGDPTTAGLISDLDRVPDLDQQIRTGLSEALASNTEVFDRWLEVHRRPSPTLVLHSGPLPQGAPAILVRDPDANPGRLVVFSEPDLDDPLLDHALSAFSADEFQVPRLAGRRLVAVAREAPNLDAIASADPPWEDVARIKLGEESFARTDLLRRQMPDLPTFDIAGIGPVRVLMTPQASPIAWDALIEPG